MALEERSEDGDPTKFVLKSKDPLQDRSFIIQGKTQKDRDEWVANLRAILDTQLDFLRGKLNFLPSFCLALISLDFLCLTKYT